MTPREYKLFQIKEREEAEELANDWHFPLSAHRKKLFQILREMEPFKLSQEDIPLRIKLVENPKWFTSEFFGGAVDLFTHDCIHIILGRGLLLKDEAFVIGYTMGSTRKISRFKRNLFMFCAKYFYPKGYRFGEEERFVFNMGVALGEQNNDDITEYPFDECLMTWNYSLSVLRQGFVNVDLLRNYYRVEKSLFPNSIESQRLI